MACILVEKSFIQNQHESDTELHTEICYVLMGLTFGVVRHTMYISTLYHASLSHLAAIIIINELYLYSLYIYNSIE